MTAMQQMLMSYGGSIALSRDWYNIGVDTARRTNSTENFSAASSGSFPDEAFNYAMFFMATGDGASTSNDIKFIAAYDGVTQYEYNVEPQDTSNKYSLGGVYYYTGNLPVGASTGYAPETAGTVVGIQDTDYGRLRLETNDTFTESGGVNSTTSSTYQTKCTVTIPTTGWYAVIASAGYLANSTSAAPRIRVWHSNSSTAYSETTNRYVKDTSNYYPYTSVQTMQLTAGDTVLLQYGSDGTNSVSIRQASLFCLYIGTSTSNPTNMKAFYYINDPTSVGTTTSTSLTTKNSSNLTITNPLNQHLLIASGQLSNSSTSYSGVARIDTNGSNFLGSDFIVEPSGGLISSVPAYYSYFIATNIVPVSSSISISAQYRTTNSAGTAYLKDANFVLIDLGV